MRQVLISKGHARLGEVPSPLIEHARRRGGDHACRAISLPAPVSFVPSPCLCQFCLVVALPNRPGYVIRRWLRMVPSDTSPRPKDAGEQKDY